MSTYTGCWSNHFLVNLHITDKGSGYWGDLIYQEKDLALTGILTPQSIQGALIYMLFQYLKFIEELFQCGTLELILMEFKNCILLSAPQNLQPSKIKSYCKFKLWKEHTANIRKNMG